MDIVNVLAALALITLLVVLVLLVVRQVRILRACREDAQDGPRDSPEARAPFDWWAWLWPMLLWVPLLLGGIVMLALLIARRMGSGGVVAGPQSLPVAAGPARPGLVQQMRDQGRRLGGAAVDLGGRAVAGVQRVGGRVVARVQSAGGRVVGGLAKQAGQLAPPTDAMSIALAGAALAFIVAAAVLGYMNTDGSMRPWLVLATVGAAVATVAMYVRCNPGDCPAAQEMAPVGTQVFDANRVVDVPQAEVGPRARSFALGESLADVKRDANLAKGPWRRQLERIVRYPPAETLTVEKGAPPVVLTQAEKQEATAGRQRLQGMLKSNWFGGEDIDFSPVGTPARSPSSPVFYSFEEEGAVPLNAPRAESAAARLEGGPTLLDVFQSVGG